MFGKEMSATPPTIFPMTDNLRAAVWRSDDNPRAAIIYFQAREQEEKVSFSVKTSARILSHFWELPQLQEGTWLTLAEFLQETEYNIFIDVSFLDSPFILGIELDTESDPINQIIETAVWDRADAQPVIAYVENNK